VEWRDPPESSLSEWRAATTLAFEAGEAADCPTGDGGTLRFLFVRSHSRISPDRGSFWIWCPVCHAYEHSSAAVPAWWVDVDVPAQELTHAPDWLDEHWQEAWLARQPVER
jgi:hypothetical protein